jgi:lipoate-protein ligase A
MKSLLNSSIDPHWNMAFDEFTLESLPVDEPVFYLWQNAPSVIIGLNQSAYAEVNLPFLEEKGIVLARRVTGGGAVYHDLGNLNYSIVGPISTMENAYGIVADALRRLGVPAERSGRNDILVDGRKCSGYAKRLYGTRMMIHGTLMWDINLEDLTQALAVPGSKLEAAGVASVRSRVANLRSYLPAFPDIRAFQDALQEMLSAGDGTIGLSPSQLEAVGKMADEKFRTWEWNFGRSPRTTFSRTKKFACGTVTAHYSLEHGVLSELQFTGDFIGARPAEELAEKLKGSKLEDLRGLEVGAFFDALSTPEFLSLLQD